MSDWDEPTQAPIGDKVPMDTFLNKLVIVRPIEFTDSMRTEYKPDGAEAVFADIALLDPHEGEPWKIFRRVLVMQGYLVGAFKGSLKKRLLGTIYHGQRKSGQKPPFMFQSLVGNAAVMERASAWWALHGEEFLAAPSATFEAPGDTDQKSSTLDSMRQALAENPYMEAPF